MARAQRIIARRAIAQYNESYRPAETGYWSHIPAWIWQDYHRKGPERCLDVGCSYGTLMVYAHLATGSKCYGLDFEPVYMRPNQERLERTYGIEWAMCNIELDPIPWEGLFDFVIFTEVLEHLNFQAVPTMIKMRDRLVEGGRMYLSTPDSGEWGVTSAYYERYEDLPQPAEELRKKVADDHIWQFSESELMAVVDASDFEVLRFDYAPSMGSRHFNMTLTPRRHG